MMPYLRGKEDPYEAQTSIPNYSWSVSYTWEELTWVLQNSGYDIGDVVDAYVSEYTDLGNVYSVTFVDSRGNTLVRTGDNARMAFYSTTLGKNVPSLRFTISGGTGGGSGVRGEQRLRHPVQPGRRVRHLRLRGPSAAWRGSTTPPSPPPGRETVSGGAAAGGSRLPGRHHRHRHRQRPQRGDEPVRRPGHGGAGL